MKRICPFFFLVLVIFAYTHLLNAQNGWNAIAPFVSNVVSFAVIGSNLFAGSDSSGVYLSINNGTSWTAVNTGLMNTYVSSLAVSGTNLFAGVGGSASFLSTNNGTSWAVASTGLSSGISVLAASGTNLFAGSSNNGAVSSFHQQRYELDYNQ